MTDTIESSDQRPRAHDAHSNHSTHERDFVPLETTEPGNARGRLRIAAILLALAVCISASSPCAFPILEECVTEADVASCLYLSLL